MLCTSGLGMRFRSSKAGIVMMAFMVMFLIGIVSA